MPKARFEVALDAICRSSSGPTAGPQRVEFLFAPRPAEPLRPLARIASGGEVSRVMLALKSVLGAADDVPVLVFDEVDAGIGGATALAVGRRLAELAPRPPGAGRDAPRPGGRVRGQPPRRREGRSATAERSPSCARSEADERVAEIARMLAGSDSEAGLAHARELMASVRAAS